MSIYDYKVRDAKGNTVSMSSYMGEVLLIVNTATGCGFTPQYEGLQNLYNRYREQGFEILDFPCNQFANQAPGTEEEIQSFCQLRYKTTFLMFAKIDVNGSKEEPLFTFLKTQQKGIMGNSIKWNFTKFLIDRKGNVIERFAPMTTPEQIEKRIQELL